MINPLVIALAASAAVFGTPAAQASGVSWSISIDVPVVVAQPVAAQGYYSDGYRTVQPAFDRGHRGDRGGAPVPRYGVVAAPLAVAAPVYVHPAPVIVAAPLPVPVYYTPHRRHAHRAEVIVVAAPRWRHHHHGWHDDRGFSRHDDRGFGRYDDRGFGRYGDR